MPEGAYKAGTIFLQVVPVFGDTMREIQRQAKDLDKALGDSAEKSGRDAGKRAGESFSEEMEKHTDGAGKKAGDKYAGEFDRSFREGLKKANREIEPIKLNIDNLALVKELAKIKAELKELEHVKIEVDGDAGAALAKFEALAARMKALQAQAKNIDARVNMDEANRAMDRFIARVKAAHPEVDVKTDFKQAERQVGAFEQKFRAAMKRAAGSISEEATGEIAKVRAELNSLGDVRIGVDMDAAAALAKSTELEARLRELNGQDVDIQADVDSAAALGQLIALHHEVNKVDRDDINVRVGIRGLGPAIAGLIGLQAAQQGAGNSTLDTANAFRSFNPLIVALAVLIPTLVPVLGAVGGALLALLPILASVGAGLGVAILGFSGIGAAVKALGNVQKNAGKDAASAAKTQRSAARSVEDAERSLARARASAADANKAAARSVADARRSAAEAVRGALEQEADAARDKAKADRDAADAQRDLRQARKDARQDLLDQGNKIAQNGIDQRQGVVDVFNATVADQQVRQDGSASNLQKEEASIALAQARLRLKESREEGKQLAAEKKRTDREGVDGTERVIQAQERVTSALEKQKDAQRALGDAARAVDKARADGARQVSDALENQRKTAENGAQSIGDAQRNLTRAQQDYRDSLKQTATEGSAAQQQLEDAMSKLGPAGQAFARYIFSLRKGFYDIRDAAQSEMLPGVRDALETVINKYGPRFRTFVARMGRSVGNSFRDAGRALTSPAFNGFFKMLNRYGPRLSRTFSKTILNWMSVFARLATIAAPFGVRLANAMERMSQAALGFVNSKRGTDTFTTFLRYAFRVGPKVWRLFVDIWKIFLALAKALAPLGELFLDVIHFFAKIFEKIPTRVLGALVTGFISLVIAIQVLVGTIVALNVGLALMNTLLFGNPLFLIIAIILLVVGAFVTLYTQVKGFRDFVNAAVKVIGAAFSWLWENVLKPVFKAIGIGLKFLWEYVFKPYLTFILWEWKLVFAALKLVWEYVLKPVFVALGKVFSFLWNYILKPYIRALMVVWTAAFKVMAWVWNNILWPIIDLFGKAIVKLFKVFFSPVIKAMVWAWKNILAPAIRAVWRTVIKPVLNAFGNAFDWLKDKVTTVVLAIIDMWEKLKGGLVAPINFVISTVLNNGLIKGFNKIAKFVGSKEMGEIPIIQFGTKAKKRSNGTSATGKRPMAGAYARGGVLPGYTPGRDTMYAHVSGGEAIMRPEWTRAIGKDQIDLWNKLARQGGVAALRNHLYGRGEAGAFAKGGVVWPTTGHRVSTYPGHDGADINGPGQDYGNPIFAFRDGKIVFTGYGHGYGNAIFERVSPSGPTVVYGHGSRVVVKAGQSVKAGQTIGFVGSTGNSSGPHLHFGIPGGTFGQAMALLRGATNVKGGGGSFLGKVASTILDKVLSTGPVKWFTKLIEKPLNKLGKTPFGRVLGGAAKKLIGGIAGFVKDHGTQSISVGAGAGGYAGVVKQALGLLGQPASLVGAVLHRLKQESGGNPRAINNWDSNARRGTPSVGLMQVIGPTFARWAGRFRNTGPFIKGVSVNPLANIFAGLNYALHRYGNIRGPMLQPGGYSEGGIVPDGNDSPGPGAGPDDGPGSAGPYNGAMLYDDGGYLRPGVTTVVNLSGKPEPVFTADQFKNFKAPSGGGGFSPTIAPVFNASDLTAEEVVDELMFEVRSAGNSGKYGGQG